MYRLLLAALVIALAATVSLTQVGQVDDGIPRVSEVFCGPVLGEDNPGRTTGPRLGPDEFHAPAWPHPDGLDPVYITGVRLLGTEGQRLFKFSDKYGIENMTDAAVESVLVGRYAYAVVEFVGFAPRPGEEEPWTWAGSSIATLVYSATGLLEPFDGIDDGALSWIAKPDGPSGYWGGGGGQPNQSDQPIYVPYWNKGWWAGKGGQITLRLDVTTSWWFAQPDNVPQDDHWYCWESRQATWMPAAPRAIQYRFDRDGVGPLPPEFVTVTF